MTTLHRNFWTNTGTAWTRSSLRISYWSGPTTLRRWMTSTVATQFSRRPSSLSGRVVP